MLKIATVFSKIPQVVAKLTELKGNVDDLYKNEATRLIELYTRDRAVLSETNIHDLENALDGFPATQTAARSGLNELLAQLKENLVKATDLISQKPKTPETVLATATAIANLKATSIYLMNDQINNDVQVILVQSKTPFADLNNIYTGNNIFYLRNLDEPTQGNIRAASTVTVEEFLTKINFLVTVDKYQAYFKISYFEDDFTRVLGSGKDNIATFNEVFDRINDTAKNDFLQAKPVVNFLKKVANNTANVDKIKLSTILQAVSETSRVAYAAQLVSSVDGFVNVFSALGSEKDKAAFLNTSEIVKILQNADEKSAAKVKPLDVIGALPAEQRLASANLLLAIPHIASQIKSAEDIKQLMSLLVNVSLQDKINFLEKNENINSGAVNAELDALYSQQAKIFITQSKEMELNDSIKSLTEAKTLNTSPDITSELSRLNGLLVTANLNKKYQPEQPYTQIFKKLDALNAVKAHEQAAELSVVGIVAAINNVEYSDKYINETENNAFERSFNAAFKTEKPENNANNFRQVYSGISKENKQKFISNEKVVFFLKFTKIADKKGISLPELLNALPDDQKLAYAKRLLDTKEAVANLIDTPELLSALMDSLSVLSMEDQVKFFKQLQNILPAKLNNSVEKLLLEQQLKIVQAQTSEQRLAFASGLLTLLNDNNYVSFKMHGSEFIANLLKLLTPQDQVNLFIKHPDFLATHTAYFGQASIDLLIAQINSTDDFTNILTSLETNDGFIKGLRDNNRSFTINFETTIAALNGNERKLEFLKAPEIKAYISKHNKEVVILKILPFDLRLDYARSVLLTADDVKIHQKGAYQDISLNEFLKPLTLVQSVQLLSEKKSLGEVVVKDLANASAQLIHENFKLTSFSNSDVFKLALDGLNPQKLNDLISRMSDSEKVQFMTNPLVINLIKEKHIDINASLTKLPQHVRLSYVIDLLKSPDYFKSAINSIEKLNALLSVLQPSEKVVVIQTHFAQIVALLKNQKIEDAPAYNNHLSKLLGFCSSAQIVHLYQEAPAAFNHTHRTKLGDASLLVLINKINDPRVDVSTFANDPFIKNMIAQGLTSNPDYNFNIVAVLLNSHDPSVVRITSESRKIEFLLSIPEILDYIINKTSKITVDRILGALPAQDRLKFAQGIVTAQNPGHLASVLDSNNITPVDKVKFLASKILLPAVVAKIKKDNYGSNALVAALSTLSLNDAKIFIASPEFATIFNALQLDYPKFISMYTLISDPQVKGQLLLLESVQSILKLKDIDTIINYLSVVPVENRLAFANELCTVNNINTPEQLQKVIVLLKPSERVAFLLNKNFAVDSKAMDKILFFAKLDNPENKFAKSELENNFKTYMDSNFINNVKNIQDPIARSNFLNNPAVVEYVKAKNNSTLTESIPVSIVGLMPSDQRLAYAEKVIARDNISISQLKQLIGYLTPEEALAFIGENEATFTKITKPNASAPNPIKNLKTELNGKVDQKNTTALQALQELKKGPGSLEVAKQIKITSQEVIGEILKNLTPKDGLVFIDQLNLPNTLKINIEAVRKDHILNHAELSDAHLKSLSSDPAVAKSFMDEWFNKKGQANPNDFYNKLPAESKKVFDAAILQPNSSVREAFLTRIATNTGLAERLPNIMFRPNDLSALKKVVFDYQQEGAGFGRIKSPESQALAAAINNYVKDKTSLTNTQKVELYLIMKPYMETEADQGKGFFGAKKENISG